MAIDDTTSVAVDSRERWPARSLARVRTIIVVAIVPAGSELFPELVCLSVRNGLSPGHAILHELHFKDALLLLASTWDGRLESVPVELGEIVVGPLTNSVDVVVTFVLARRVAVVGAVALDLLLESVALLELLVELPPLIDIELGPTEHRFGPLASVLVPEGGTLGRSLALLFELTLLSVLAIEIEASLLNLLSVLLALLLGNLAVRFGLDFSDPLVLGFSSEHELSHATELGASGGDFLDGEIVHGERFRLGNVRLSHLGRREEVGDGRFEIVTRLKGVEREGKTEGRGEQG